MCEAHAAGWSGIVHIFQFHAHLRVVYYVAFSVAFSDSVFVAYNILDFQVVLAEKTAVLFTKDGDQHNNLHDMQCMWYVFNDVQYSVLS